jgi:hypothetical protein
MKLHSIIILLRAFAATLTACPTPITGSLTVTISDARAALSRATHQKIFSQHLKLFSSNLNHFLVQARG